jgi:NAD-dependent dihydropyrimidine dehydrogenase PreA subunit
MPVIVEFTKCTRCGTCVEVCPLDTLRLDDHGRPYDKYNECWYCGCCEAKCPVSAITMELPYLVK